jgi:hypothetical protein
MPAKLLMLLKIDASSSFASSFRGLFVDAIVWFSQFLLKVQGEGTFL